MNVYCTCVVCRVSRDTHLTPQSQSVLSRVYAVSHTVYCIPDCIYGYTHTEAKR